MEKEVALHAVLGSLCGGLVVPGGYGGPDHTVKPSGSRTARLAHSVRRAVFKREILWGKHGEEREGMCEDT